MPSQSIIPNSERIADLEAQLGVQASRVATLERELAAWLNDRKRLDAENAELRAVLREAGAHGYHAKNCALVIAVASGADHADAPCTCWLSAARRTP